MVALEEATEAQLLEELARRMSAKAEPATAPAAWCDDCVHFVPKADATESYNPCRKRHRMAFWLPDDVDPFTTDEPWGFNRPGCPDRKDRPEPVAGDPEPQPELPLSWEDPAYRQTPPPRGQGPRR